MGAEPAQHLGTAGAGRDAGVPQDRLEGPCRHGLVGMAPRKELPPVSRTDVGPAPVTGRILDGPPADADLAVEERAAIELSRDRDRSGPEHVRAAGAARALGWILGFAPISR
ncbi:hypothetical protein [Kitasatospora sp. NPDC058046]|uniref:hypothetical protein n=1 Tax=Kitasatospora sp. NPDC058046 TaxID=3346312 RepID=UPI0036DC8196